MSVALRAARRVLAECVNIDGHQMMETGIKQNTHSSSKVPPAYSPHGSPGAHGEGKSLADVTDCATHANPFSHTCYPKQPRLLSSLSL